MNLFLKITLLTFFCFNFCFQSLAIGNGRQAKGFTRCDTLRGSLRDERTCYDVTYYDLSVTIDTAKQAISGVNKIYYKALQTFDVMQIDFFSNMVIDKIEYKGVVVPYKRECDAVFVYTRKELTQARGSEGSLEVYFHGYPKVARNAPWDGGFTWKYDEEGTPFIATSVQGIGASLWYPCKDYLGDEPDSMRISITCPQNLTAVSNGQYEGVEKNEDGTQQWKWFVSYPINTYNVSLNLGNYAHFEDEFTYSDGEKLKLNYYVLKYNLDKAKEQFKQVKPMLKCYEKYLGKYPFMRDGYKLIEVPYLGMEHQSAIAYGNGYKNGYAGIDFSKIGVLFDYIIIHESGHEWWGNSVSCKDLADMWIHESFCTYTESIYVECLHDYKTALRYINAKKNTVGNRSPIIGPYGVNQEGDKDMYSKGSLILNTFRSVLGNDNLWWSLIKNISDTTFKIKNVDANELLAHINKYTGYDFTAMFNQYFRYAAIPTFVYTLKKAKGKEYELKYRWQTDVPNFKMPVFIQTGNGKNQRIECANEEQTLKMKLASPSKFLVNENLIFINVQNTSTKAEK
ncbi:MAG: M1 family metallopeptidase [Chitinophagales bacterium]|nr:M1 family metallopeptidase [Chitinophagales bacterium]